MIAATSEKKSNASMKIAVIGSGVSGLVAAHRLCQTNEVTLFEANEYLGGHTNTVDVEWMGERFAIDTGFIVFNDWTYPSFIGLLDELGVASQPTEMSFSFSDRGGGLEYNGHSLNTLFAQRRNLLRPGFYRMLADIVRFNRDAPRAAAECAETTVEEFLASQGYSRQFAEHYLLPMGAAIWSCPTGAFGRFPVRFVVDFYRNHGLLNLVRRPTWRTISGGSRSYVQAIANRFRGQIRLRTPVRSVRRLPSCVEVQPQGGEIERFDHVIFACHSDQALRILAGDATATERDVLSAFPYERNVAILHTDVSVLPRSRRAWASWNFRGAGDSASPPSVTYNMNILQRLDARHTYCVTLNDETSVAPGRVLRRFEYHHPVFTLRRAAAQARQGELLCANRTSFCGAYWRNGFHEDGVVSALAVVKSLQGDSLPDEMDRSAIRQDATAPLLAGADA